MVITTVYFLPLGEPAAPAALGEAVATYMRDSGLRLDRITPMAKSGKTRAFKVSSLAELCADPTLENFTLWNRTDFSHSMHVFFRDGFRDKARTKTDDDWKFYAQRHGHVISPSLPPGLTDALRAFLLAIATQSRLAQGFVAGFERYHDAMRECMCGGAQGPRDPDPAREERLIIDGRRYYEKDKLRRLYPITIIGPDIWASLPPMPAFDPMPLVEDLGDCKVLTAWPELCDPRDPAFLRGTRALREWLWPYTIQNPADHVDNDPPAA